MNMIGNAISELFLSTPGLTANGAPQRASSRNDRLNDDSFSGVFREKMREASSKPVRRAGAVGVERPLEPSSKTPPDHDESKVERGKSPSAEADSKVNDIGLKADDKEAEGAARPDDGDESSKDDSSGAEEATDILKLVASLLESLFEGLGEPAADSGDQTVHAPGTVATDGEGRFEAIKGLLEGKMENLIKLLERVQPDEKASGISGLMDELKSLLAKVEELRGSDTAGANGRIVIETVAGERDNAPLIAQLHTKAREIMDKLKTRVSEALSKDKPASGESAVKEGILPNVETRGSVTEVKEEPGPWVRETKTEHSNRPEAAEAPIVKAEAGIETHRGQAPQETVNSDVAPLEPKNADMAKLGKTEFHLSEKPLGQTVTNQVMMRIKLMAGENRQEMEVHLKPESLGKLTLRIIHERGEILAKITAESEQVKSILESNMQLLKDSLEKSGLSVQSLNVSVGNENGGSQAQDRETKKERPSEAGASRTEGRNGSRAGTLHGRDMPDGIHSIDLSA